MKITVLNGTQIRGITYHYKEKFLSHFRDALITQYYPNDYPDFCLGCKNCFLKGEEYCPHIDKIGAIWDSILDSDIIVVAYPTYALRTPASIKVVLDHLCRHWMVHRPNDRLFTKKVAILTNSVGPAFQQKNAVKDVETSFSWLGVGFIRHSCAGMMGDIFWDKIKKRTDNMLDRKAEKLYKRMKVDLPIRHMKMNTRIKFKMCKFLHASILKGEETPSVDNQYFIDKGWIKGKKR